MLHVGSDACAMAEWFIGNPKPCMFGDITPIIENQMEQKMED